MNPTVMHGESTRPPSSRVPEPSLLRLEAANRVHFRRINFKLNHGNEERN